MKTAETSSFWAGLATSLPLILGYFPIAFSFGVAATRSGLTSTEAFALSLIIYSGASQFVAVTLIASGTPLLVMAFTLIAMNLRHVLYGPALIKRTGAQLRLRHAWAWSFGLTVEVFGATLGSLARGRPFTEPFMFGLGLGAYAAWLSGTAAGALAGGGALDAYPAISAGLGFMLPALFLALMLSILTKAQIPVILLAGAVTVGITLYANTTAGLLAGMVAGAVLGLLRRGPNAQ